jgi:hypothetical protein
MQEGIYRGKCCYAAPVGMCILVYSYSLLSAGGIKWLCFWGHGIPSVNVVKHGTKYAAPVGMCILVYSYSLLSAGGIKWLCFWGHGIPSVNVVKLIMELNNNPVIYVGEVGLYIRAPAARGDPSIHRTHARSSCRSLK